MINKDELKSSAMINKDELKSSANEASSIMESPEEKKRRFLIEFENPFKCDKCNERFKKKKYLREHKAEVHAY
ncbi:MAG: hypothetical protein H0X03_06395 [Nitrosopumilus sp.]|nr:hypothetical protein [Nitrosopumilus sp.]